PTDAIFLILIFPVPKTIAFGGVPTGSMYAQLAAIAAGTISNSGCTFTATENVASIGKIIVAVAVLEVISVKNRTNIVIIITTIVLRSSIINRLSPSISINCTPNHYDNRHS